MKTLEHNFTNDQGKEMTARVVFQGETFGVDNDITHDQPMPLVEFYFRGPKSDPKGSFISRYNLDILIDTSGGNREGLCLDGRMREFDLSSDDMEGVVRFLQVDVLRALMESKALSPHEVLELQIKSLSRDQAERFKEFLMLCVESGEGGAEVSTAPQVD